VRRWVPEGGNHMPTRKRLRLTDKEFDRVVKRTIRRIPAEIREHLDNVLITIMKRPSDEMLRRMGMPEDEPLLGIYEGVSLDERSISSPPLYPDTIFLFQEPIEEMCETVEELEAEIEITVVHEIAHALGMDEERLAELGYG
jgi:predicted Zn-dependent protease with MMP-like domain